MKRIRQLAAGYLLKSSTVEQIVDGIRTVAGGGALLDSSVAKYIFDSLQKQQPSEALEYGLSDREQEILALMAEGMVKKEVAKELDIGVTTVATYIRRIYEKLDVQNAPSAVAKAYRIGLFPRQ